jgi:hypothetical protein
MAKMRIKASSLFTKHVLDVTDRGVVWIESTLFGGKVRIPFTDIQAVLRGPDWISLQVQRKIYKIPVKASNAGHRAAIARLVAECRRTLPRPPARPAAPVSPPPPPLVTPAPAEETS